ISYQGSSIGQVLVCLFSNPAFSGSPVYVKGLSQPGAYSLNNVQPGSYYLWAFLDTNKDVLFDASVEPSGQYSNNPVTIIPGATQSDLNFSLNDPVELPGDINFDRVINIGDVVISLRMLLELDITIGAVVYPFPYSERLRNVSDIDQNGCVDIYDLIFVLQRALRII
ncbi:MAG: hypothetical protein NC911_07355, partial [Candidatus Omnitrophica bacterium]|nr:hypothetical protein [Candidatus Omnitrophota bacterium]